MSQTLMHSLDEKTPQEALPKKKLITMLVIALVAGTVVGSVAGMVNKGKKQKAGGISDKKAEKVVGISDKTIFKDQAEGILREGGIEGEGSFHLERPGGKSQNVYLTSSTVDLAEYIGKRVRVHGETFAAQKAGWLMDVGLVEILQ